jgi:RHS repeat-associated protein
VQQQDDYFPFGFEINRTPYTPKNEYLYNKKELQPEFTEYDYGARFYDPVIARWTTIDPDAENSRRWSPYNYVENNPIRLIDPDGMNGIDAEIQEAQDRFMEEIRDDDKKKQIEQSISEALGGKSDVKPGSGEPKETKTMQQDVTKVVRTPLTKGSPKNNGKGEIEKLYDSFNAFMKGKGFVKQNGGYVETIEGGGGSPGSATTAKTTNQDHIDLTNVLDPLGALTPMTNALH